MAGRGLAAHYLSRSLLSTLLVDSASIGRAASSTSVFTCGALATSSTDRLLHTSSFLQHDEDAPMVQTPGLPIRAPGVVGGGRWKDSNTQRVIRTASEAALQQAVAADAAALGKKAEEKSEEKTVDEYDYWGLKHASRTPKGATSNWKWHSFSPSDAYTPNLNTPLDKHYRPENIGDRVALNVVKFLRFLSDIFFQKRYGNRAVMLETVAAVPGMVGGALQHCKSLRRFEHSGGWIKALLEEAENERMHLMTFMEVVKPVWWERALVFITQGIFFNGYFVLYLVSPKTAHRVVGYLEEEAVISYTRFLEAIDAGKIENVPAPAIAIDYWKLPKDATLRDVVIVVRADEAHHRDVNHFAATIIKKGEELHKNPAPADYH